MDKEDAKKFCIETIELNRPDFVDMVKKAVEDGSNEVIIKQFNFGDGYWPTLMSEMGMCVKYAGLYNLKITIIPND